VDKPLLKKNLSAIPYMFTLFIFFCKRSGIVNVVFLTGYTHPCFWANFRKILILVMKGNFDRNEILAILRPIRDILD
jgi:hypothetical protein